MIIYIKIFAIKFSIKVISIKNNRNNIGMRKIRTLYIYIYVYIYYMYMYIDMYMYMIFIYLFNLVTIYILSYKRNIYRYIN